MKANRKALQDDDRGLTVVIGAILVAGLLFATVVTIRVRYVPTWTEDAEAIHMRTVEQQLATLTADIGRQTQNVTQQSITDPVSLGTGHPGFFRTRSPAHGLTLAGADRSIVLSSNRIRVQEEDGSSFLGVDETWTPISAATDSLIEAVDRAISFRLRLDSVSDDNAGDQVQIRITDADGAAAGQITVSIATHPGGVDVNYRTLSPASAELFDQGDSYADQTITPYWIDLLRPDLRFAALLSATKAPFRLTLDLTHADSGAGNRDIEAEYAATYSYANGGTSIIAGGGGQVRTNWAETYADGMLSYEADNQRFPAQEYHLESGALILEQSDGDVFAIEPSFEVALVGNVTRVEMTIPVISGRAASLRGQGTAAVTAHANGRSTLLAQMPRLNITLETDHPALWAALWTAELDAVPDFDSGEEFTVASTATTATLNLYGASVSPASTYYDLSLLMRQADIQIDLRG